MKKIICVLIVIIAAVALLIALNRVDVEYPFVYVKGFPKNIPTSSVLPINLEIHRVNEHETIDVHIYEGKSSDGIDGKEPVAVMSHHFDGKSNTSDYIDFSWNTSDAPGDYFAMYYMSVGEDDDVIIDDSSFIDFKVMTPCVDHTFVQKNKSIYGDVGTKSDCYNHGTAFLVCEICGYEELTELDYSHYYGDGTVIVKANCRNDGYKSYECTKCGAIKAEVIPADPEAHVMRSIITKPTATRPGKIDLKCDVCGFVKSENTEIPALFMELDPSVYYEAPVRWAYNNELFDKMENYEFHPNEPCTKETIMRFLYIADGNTSYDDIENPFSDVSEDDIFIKAAKWSYGKGIETGERFNPYDTCTRGMLVELLWNLAGRPVVNTDHGLEDVSEEDSFNDAVKWSISEGIMSGMEEGMFVPDYNCTQAQIITILYRVVAQ